MPSVEFDSRTVGVLDSEMHYLEGGSGAPILFIHGNPTSSYLWRNVMPYVVGQGRVIAVDLIGMGRSGKPDIPYRFMDHLRYLDAFVEALDLRDLTLVLHDWGGGLGLSYARRHSENIKGVAFMEAVVKPIERSEMQVPMRILFDRMRHPEKGDRMNKDRNFFVRWLLPMMAGRRFTAKEKAVYRAPYPTPESRTPVAMWPREIPISGQPADMASEIGANFDWLREVDLPKLFLYAWPGAIFQKQQVADIRAAIPDLESVYVGRGVHYLQETVPDAIGEALSAWIANSLHQRSV